MVRRLIQKQSRRIAEKRLRQQHADFLAALQISHPALVQRIIHVQTVEQNSGIGLRRVTILVADDGFEFCHAHAIAVRQLVMGFCVQRIALLQGFPQNRIAHDDGIDHAKLVERKLVLPQHAELLRPADRALRGLEFAGHDFHQRGFARAIRTGDGVAPPVKKRAGDVFEQNPIAEAHGDVIEGNQDLQLYRMISARAGLSEDVPQPARLTFRLAEVTLLFVADLPSAQ